MIAPGATLGVLGGGQLGRMFALAAHRLGYRVAVLDPDPDCPASAVANIHVCEALDCRAGWEVMADLCAAVTIETESVPAEALEWFAGRMPVAPGAGGLRIAQDRAREKNFLAANGFAVAPYRVVGPAALSPSEEIDLLLPGLLKSSRFGYDGKGQFVVNWRAELAGAMRELGGCCVLERRMNLAAELSVILARAPGGDTAVYPVPLNRHVCGILDLSIVPAPLPPEVVSRAISESLRLAALLDYRGVLCVEFFLTREGELLVNEIAPRPHNSGHFTLDACHTSQFEQQVRVLAGMPLGDPGLIAPQSGVAMANLLGEFWAAGEPAWDKVLSAQNVRLHLYGKRDARPGRKMGHFTCLAGNPAEAETLAANIRAAAGPLAARRQAPQLQVMSGTSAKTRSSPVDQKPLMVEKYGSPSS
ncbi:MAG: 5-(carboxyamino)imidazole ribonucleotide synthase [Betaproteobacteria bacterium]